MLVDELRKAASIGEVSGDYKDVTREQAKAYVEGIGAQAHALLAATRNDQPEGEQASLPHLNTLAAIQIVFVTMCLESAKCPGCGEVDFLTLASMHNQLAKRFMAMTEFSIHKLGAGREEPTPHHH